MRFLVTTGFRATSVLFGLLLATFLSSNAGAVSFDEAYRALQGVDEDFVNSGTICEYVARLELQKEFPPSRHEVLIGVSYLVDDQVVGELDVVIQERVSRTIEVIGEVKCWKNLESGLEKANEQEQRFRTTLADVASSLRFVKFDGSRGTLMPFERATFVSNLEHLSIGQKGARAVGYDRELEMSLEELMDLRKKLMSGSRKSGAKKR